MTKENNEAMKTKFIAGNWKMYKTVGETEELLRGVMKEAAGLPNTVQVAVCPPYTSLALAAQVLKGSRVALGAQNMSEHDEGPYTGEISWKMLKAAGCSHVILGHSERRQYYGETDQGVNRKAVKALANGLIPILCVGETLAQREGGVTASVITTQVKGVLQGIPGLDVERCVIAYEPVWAIGTGKTATPEQAQEVHAQIRALVSSLYSRSVSEKVLLQYGGSVKADNAATLMRQHDIDGALVGGACLKADSFGAILRGAV